VPTIQTTARELIYRTERKDRPSEPGRLAAADFDRSVDRQVRPQSRSSLDRGSDVLAQVRIGGSIGTPLKQFL
jgi:hypothetical protein